MRKSILAFAVAMSSCSAPAFAEDKPDLMVFIECEAGKPSVMVKSASTLIYAHHNGSIVYGVSKYRYSKIDDVVSLAVGNKDDAVAVSITASNPVKAGVVINGRVSLCKVTKVQGEF